MDLQQRIEQFQNMAAADPDNEMAHFSLGNALLQAGRPADAASSFLRAVELNPGMSKAYQLAGQALIDSGRRDDAAMTLRKGYEVAAERGDRLPVKAMAELLTSIGEPLPKVAVAETASSADGGTFLCQTSGRAGTQLEKPPFKGPLGQKIYESVSRETWREWIAQGTKVINELRLDLSREDHQQLFDQHMIEFLGLEEWAAENLKNEP